jgi:hypothetical protein
MGYILYRQSFDKGWIATYFEKGYTKRQAFRNWKKYALARTHTRSHRELRPPCSLSSPF